MSANLSANNSQDRDFLNRIAKLEQQMREKGTVQVQGSDALGLGILEGYIMINVPTDTDPHIEYVDVTAPNNATILIGSLVYSTYLIVPPSGLAANIDYTDGALGDEEWQVWMTYDGRNPTTPPDISAGDIPNNKVADNTARVVFRLRRSDGSPVIGPGPYVVFYQIRATFN